MTTKKTEVIEIKPIEEVKFNIRVVGDTPLIMHRWTEKAKRQMLEGMKSARKGKAKDKKTLCLTSSTACTG